MQQAIKFCVCSFLAGTLLAGSYHHSSEFNPTPEERHPLHIEQSVSSASCQAVTVACIRADVYVSASGAVVAAPIWTVSDS